MTPIPFHQWKTEQIKKDSKDHGVFQYMRRKDWYWKKYGEYCRKIRLVVVPEGGCPCKYTTPCHQDCTCVNPFSSRGCMMCCTYGSLEQRTEQEERLVDMTNRPFQIEKRIKRIPERFVATDGAEFNTIEEAGDYQNWLDFLGICNTEKLIVTIFHDRSVEVHPDVLIDWIDKHLDDVAKYVNYKIKFNKR